MFPTRRIRRAVAVLVAATTLAWSAGSVGPAGAASTTGIDISWPQCGGSFPARPAFGIVGVNDGRPDTANPCLAQEYKWALASGAVEFYMNTANPGLAVADGYAYGFDAARNAYTYASAHASAGPGHWWWLDVETANTWSGPVGANAAVIAGSVAFFRGQGIAVGIYSTRYQWGLITGGASVPSVPDWVPGAASAAQAAAFCSAQQSFTGGPVVMAQYTTDVDHDYLCPGVTLPTLPPVAPPPAPNLITALLAWLRSL